MKVLHVWKRFDHHAGRSGYDQLTRHLPEASRYAPGKVFRWLHAQGPERFRRVRAIDPEWYNFENFCLEMDLSVRLRMTRHTICHLLYGENFHRLLSAGPLRRGNRVVASFHQPPDVFPRAIRRPGARRRTLRRADAVVVVGSNQVSFFRELTGRDNVHLVPHGVDTEYFTPPEAPRPVGGPLRCLSVGWWLRDVELIRRVIRTFNQLRDPRVEFHVVTFPWCQEFYQGLDDVHLYTAIPDDDLRALYRSCHVLFLPLTDCTANNAILEAMACGLPVFTTAVGGIRDYVDDDCGVIAAPPAEDILTDALLAAARDPGCLAPKGEQARRRAECFAWPRTAAWLRDIYARLA